MLLAPVEKGAFVAFAGLGVIEVDTVEDTKERVVCPIIVIFVVPLFAVFVLGLAVVTEAVVVKLSAVVDEAFECVSVTGLLVDVTLVA